MRICIGTEPSGIADYRDKRHVAQRTFFYFRRITMRGNAFSKRRSTTRAFTRSRTWRSLLSYSSCFCLIVLICSPRALAGNLWDETWIEARSPHFVIVSALSEARTVELVKDLENFRTAAASFSEIGDFHERIQTRTFVFPYASIDFSFVGQKAGYFVPGTRTNFAAVIATEQRPDESLKHEYSHYLLHSRDQTAFPTWLDEGFAQVVSSLSVKDTKVELGDILPWQGNLLGWGDWMAFGQILESRGTVGLTPFHRSQFYAQSWLLVHYLMLGRPNADFSTQLRSYLHAVESGVVAQPAFEQAFGMAVTDLRKTLRQYMRSVGFRTRALQHPYPASQVTVRAMPRDQIAAALGDLAFRVGRYETAQRCYDAATNANANNANAHAGTGNLLQHAKKLDQAEQRFQKALALEPNSALHELDYAELLLARARAAKGTPRAHADLEEARKRLARSNQLDANIPETLEMIGLTFLEPGEHGELALAPLLLAYQMLPSNFEIRLALTGSYAASHQLDKARSTLNALTSWAEIDDVAAVERTLIELDRRTTTPFSDALHEAQSAVPNSR